jgi:broad specificity phosphatase PhoE
MSVVLSEQGISRIKLIAESLKKENIDLIFSSDYLRTKQTAEIVAKILNLKVIADIRLGDTNIGNYYGKSKAEFYDEFPDPIQRFELGPKGGESWNDVKKRLSVFLKEVEEKYQDKNILIVGHGDSLWLFEGLIRESTDQELLDIIFNKKEYIKKGELKRVN